MEVLVFKTNLANQNLIDAAKPILQKIKGVLRWNVDREDIDNVLRIEARNISPLAVATAFAAAGFMCEELPD